MARRANALYHNHYNLFNAYREGRRSVIGASEEPREGDTPTAPK